MEVQDITCYGDETGSFSVAAFGGTPTYLYALEDGELDTLNNFSGLSAGTYDLQVEDSLGCSATFEIELTTNDSLYLNVDSLTNLTCFESENGYFEWSGVGGANAYAVSLNGADFVTDTVFSGLTAGTYVFELKDTLGCLAIDSVELTQPEAIVVTGSDFSNLSCFDEADGTISLSANGGTGILTYTLGGESNTTGEFEGLTAGMYEVVITDEFGCTNIDPITFVLTMPEPLEVEALMITDVACAGEANGMVTIAGIGGTGNYIYSLGNMSNGNGLFDNLSAGDYTATIEDENGCTVTQTVLVEEPTSVTLSVEEVISPDCVGGTSGSITLVASGGAGDYLYTLNGATNATGIFDGLAAGIYNGTVEDGNGCTIIEMIDLSDPESVMANLESVTSVSCFGETDGALSVTATGGSGNYTYSLGDNSNTTGTFGNLPSGGYQVTIEDENGCAVVVEAMVETPEAVSGLVETSIAIACAGETATVNVLGAGGTGTLSYTLNGATNTTGTFTGLTGGDYSVEITDTQGCSGNVAFSVEAPTPLEITSSSTMPASCFGAADGVATFEATGGTEAYTYELGDLSNTSGMFSGLPAGDYSLTVVDANGCAITNTVSIDEPDELVANAVVSAPISCSDSVDGSLQIQAEGGNGSYSYQLGDSENSDGLFTNLAAGDYTVQVTDANGCTVTIFQTLEAPPSITASIDDQTAASCADTADGSVQFGAEGGTGTLTYMLNGQSNTTGTFSGLAANQYQVMITDANGCTVAVDFSITAPAALELNYELLTANSCAGDSEATLQLVANGGVGDYTFTFNGQDNQDGFFSNLPAGQFLAQVEDANGCFMAVPVAIVEPDELVADFVLEGGVGCGGDATASIQVVVSGGAGNYSYTLGGQSNDSGLFENLGAGTYPITIVDANGCTIDLSATIEEPEVLAIDVAGTTDVICAGDATGEVVLAATGGTGTYTFELNGMVNNVGTFANLGAGTYMAVVTDANGCTSMVEVQIEEPEALMPDAVVIEMPLCTGDATGIIQLSATGGNGAYSFTLSDQTNMTGTFAALPAGIYTAVVADSEGCVSTEIQVEIEEPEQLMAVVGIPNPVSCAGAADATLEVSAMGGVGDYTYTLGDETNTSGLFEGLAAGTYPIEVTDANGCTIATNFVLTEPTVLSVVVSQNDPISCSGASDGGVVLIAEGGTAPFTYELNGETNDSGMFSDLAPGSYAVQVTDANGCVTTSEVMIFDVPVIEFGVEVLANVACAGGFSGSVQLTAAGGNGGFQYQLGNQTNMTGLFEDLAAGTYPVVAIDENGCAIESEVTITEPAPIETDAEVLAMVDCFGESTGVVQLSAGGGTGNFTFVINDEESTTGLFENLAAGTYMGFVFDANQCPGMVSFTVEQPDPISVSITNTEADNGMGTGAFTVVPSGGVAPYQIALNGGPFDAIDTFNGLPAGEYMVEVRDANGCIFSTTVEVLLVDAVFEGSDLVESFGVYPNPYRETLTLDMQLHEASQVRTQLYHINGQLLLQAEHEVGSGSWQWQWAEAGKLPAGTYLLRVVVGGEQGLFPFSKTIIYDTGSMEGQRAIFLL